MKPLTQRCLYCGATITAAASDGLCSSCLANATSEPQVQSDQLPTVSGNGSADGETVGAPGASLSSRLPSEKPGDRIGRYKLLEQIGEGGCGVVYLAEQEGPIRRRVALKVIKLGMDTRQVVARFEAERQALAMMDHPNIAKVYDAGATATGRPFFVMELVRGTPLTEYCDQKKLPTRERLHLFIHVCHAIQHAHQKGIIHRDIKPSNILVTLHDDTPVPKVIDFGIAKAMGEQLTEKTVFTRFEQYVGTPTYMSPEQAGMSGLDVDTRSDLYSLGVLLYELLTGHTPFDPDEMAKSGVQEMLRQIREEEPPRPSTRLRTLCADELTKTAQRRQTESVKLLKLLRVDLDWIVLKCLEKNPTRRYETATGLARDIERHLRNEPVTAAAPGFGYRATKFARRHRTALSTVAGFVLLLVAGTIVSVWEAVRANVSAEDSRRHAAWSATLARRESAQRLLAESMADQLRHQAYASDMKAAQVALQQENRGVAVELLRRYFPKPGQEDLRGLEWRYLWNLSQTDELLTLPHPAFPILTSVAFSRDGKYIVTTSLDGKTRIWSLDSGKVVQEIGRSAIGGIAPSLSFSPDGKWLAVACARELLVLDVVDWRVTHEFKAAPPADFFIGPKFASDSHRLLAASGGRLYLWDVGSWAVQTITNLWAYDVALLPDEVSLAGVLRETGKLVLFNLKTGAVENLEPAAGTGALTVSPNGKWLAAGDSLGRIYVWDLPSRKLTINGFRAHQALIWKLAFSPDSKVLASGAVGAARLWEAGTTNRIATLDGHLGDVVSLDFSPDGQTLATASKDGTVKMWNTRPTTPKDRVLRLPREMDPVGVLRDGSSLLCVDRKTRAISLWSLTQCTQVRSFELTHFLERGCKSVEVFAVNRLIVGVSTNGTLEFWDLPSGEPARSIQLENSIEGVLSLSPDRHWVVLSRRGQRGPVLHDLVQNKEQTLPDWFGPMTPQFSPDGRWLALRSGALELRIWDLTNGCEKAVLGGHRWYPWAMRFSPDSKRLVSGGADPEIRVWSMETFKLARSPLKGHQTCLGRLIFSSDGKTLVSDSEDMTLRWWNMATGQEMLLFGDAQIIAGGPDAWADWNLDENTMLWWEPGGLLRITSLPSLAQIDQIEATRIAQGFP